MIVITRSFSKDLSHFDASIRDELVSLISKHKRWLKTHLLPLRNEGDFLVLKGYLGANAYVWQSQKPKRAIISLSKY